MQLQKVIQCSSFAEGAKSEHDRFDDKVDGKLLQHRDRSDAYVADLTQKLLVILKNLFSE